MRKWLHVDLTLTLSRLFKDFLRKNNIKYEISANHTLVHIETYVNENERKMCDDFLEKLDNL